jgi:hypothetical protein
VQREQRAGVDVGEDVGVPDQHVSGAEPVRRVRHATCRTQQLGLAHDVERQRERGEHVRREDLREVERVDHRTPQAAGAQALQDVRQRRSIADGDERLRELVAERSQPRAQAGGEHHGGGGAHGGQYAAIGTAVAKHTDGSGGGSGSGSGRCARPAGKSTGAAPGC